MKIPVELLHRVVWFVYDHYTGKGLVSSPSEIATQCGVLTSEWLSMVGDGVACCGYSEMEIVSHCERLGKSLASFFISEREG